MDNIGDILCIGGGAHYRLERQIARASFGAVWSATWIEAGSRVALKTVRHDHMQAHRRADQALWPQSLQREIAFLETIRAAHIVYFLRKGACNGLPVIVLEELDTSLDMLIRPKPGMANLPAPDLAQILAWLRQIAEGLGALHRHRRGFRHLDLKPNNLLLTKAGALGRKIKIADFGDIKSNDQTLHPFCGTLGWQAPEQFFPCAQGTDGFQYRTDQRTDFFALGLLFFYLVTGEKTEFAQRSALLHQHAQETGAWRARDEAMPTLTPNDTTRFLRALQTPHTADRMDRMDQVDTALDDQDGTWRPGIGAQPNAHRPAPQPPAAAPTPAGGTAALTLLQHLLAATPEARPADAKALLHVIEQAMASANPGIPERP